MYRTRNFEAAVEREELEKEQSEIKSEQETTVRKKSGLERYEFKLLDMLKLYAEKIKSSDKRQLGVWARILVKLMTDWNYFIT